MQPQFLTAAIGGVFYLLHPEVIGTIQEDVKPDNILPVTLLTTEELFNPDIDNWLKGLESQDDVYSDAFTFALVEKPAKGAASKAPATRKRSTAIAQKTLFTTTSAQDQPWSLADLPTGPYILHGKELHAAYKLYDDDEGSFDVGIIPELWNATDKFLDLHGLKLDDPAARPIAVPSKLYQPAPSADRPLSGVRFSIPENLDVSGVVSTFSSRNYSSIQTAATSHAAYVKNLLAQGATLIGKTKASQFGSSRDWIDTVAPHNTRQDRHQKPGGTDAGAGSGLAGQFWYPYAIGQDHLHGVRDLGAIYGLHTLRLTPDLVPSTGFHVSSPKFSTPGVLTRNLTDLAFSAPALLGQPLAKINMPKRLIVPTDFFPLANAEFQKLLDLFVSAAQGKFNFKVERISIADLWAKKPPCKAKGKDLNKFLGKAPFKAFCYDFYHNFDTFRAEFDKKEGHAAFEEPDVAFQWAVGKNVTKEKYESYLARIDLFNKWFTKHVMPSTSGSDAHAVMLLPNGPTASQPVDGPNERKAPKGLRPELLAPILGLPQITSPFAQTPMDQSSFGNYLDVAASLMGAKNDDLMLVQLMHMVFQQSKWREFVHPGYQVFPVGEPPRYVDDDAYYPY